MLGLGGGRFISDFELAEMMISCFLFFPPSILLALMASRAAHIPHFSDLAQPLLFCFPHPRHSRRQGSLQKRGIHCTRRLQSYLISKSPRLRIQLPWCLQDPPNVRSAHAFNPVQNLLDQCFNRPCSPTGSPVSPSISHFFVVQFSLGVISSQCIGS